MADIVERLRDRDAVVLSGLFHAIPTMMEAALEIERLRDQLGCTEAMVEAGAQALVNDQWHPPQPLSSLSGVDARRYRRQALLVLKAAFISTLPSTEHS